MAASILTSNICSGVSHLGEAICGEQHCKATSGILTHVLPSIMYLHLVTAGSLTCVVKDFFYILSMNINSLLFNWISVICSQPGMDDFTQTKSCGLLKTLCMWNIPWLFHAQLWPVRIQLVETIYSHIHHHLSWSCLRLTTRCQIPTFTHPCSSGNQIGTSNGRIHEQNVLLFCY